MRGNDVREDASRVVTRGEGGRGRGMVEEVLVEGISGGGYEGTSRAM